jgi:hypothetical protein
VKQVLSIIDSKPDIPEIDKVDAGDLFEDDKASVSTVASEVKEVKEVKEASNGKKSEFDDIFDDDIFDDNDLFAGIHGHGGGVDLDTLGSSFFSETGNKIKKNDFKKIKN